MSLSKMRRKSQKGFTLVELMIVIAVIAILAAVLIPNSQKFRESAKEAGIEANARIAQGLTESMITRVESDNFPQNLAARLGTESDSVFTNPITDKSGVKLVTSYDDDLEANKYAAYVSTAEAPNVTGNVTKDEVKGTIWLQVDKTNKKVIITPYDRNGNKMEPITVTK